MILTNLLGTIEGIGLDTFSTGVPYAILALGIFISYRILDFADLGCEGCFTLGGAITAVLVYQNVNPVIALIIATIAGALAGLVTGVLTTKLHIAPLLSGIITMTALFTINLIIMGIYQAKSMGEPFNFFTSNSTYVQTSLNNRFYYPLYSLMKNSFGISGFKPIFSAIIMMLIVMAIVIGLIYYFFGTEIGMGIRATGMNSIMARAQGINTSQMTIIGLMISNALIGLSGGLISQITGSTSSTMGTGVLVIGLASIIIGEAVVGKKTFKQNMFAVIVGAIIYYLIISIVINTGLLEPHFLKLLYAILIVIILVLSNLKTKKKVKGR